MIAVLCGSMREFTEFCRFKQIPSTEAVYIWSKQSLTGREFTSFVRIGTWHTVKQDVIQAFDKADLIANHRVPAREQ